MTKQEQIVANYPKLMLFVKNRIKVPFQDRRDVVHTCVAQCLASDNPDSCELKYMFKALVSVVLNYRRRENAHERKRRKFALVRDFIRHA